MLRYGNVSLDNEYIIKPLIVKGLYDIVFRDGAALRDNLPKESY